GVVHPILLTAVMRFNMPSCPARMADIGRVILDKRLGSDDETALAGIAKLEDFFASFNVSLRLSDEVSEGDRQYLEPICKMAVNDVCNLTNPKPASWEDLLSICEEVW
ncbi:MAG: iron-containing alcohol dehydrogenase, partial [Proteobacteria bacterium]|nr:iron-containing alcohol dehydrogenase [Pseudomonadota bacterium]